MKDIKDIKNAWRALALAIALVAGLTVPALAQPTTGSVVGVAADESGGVLPGATVVAIHEPSGSRYEAVTRGDGKFAIQGMRVGGPYLVTISLPGFQTSATRNVTVSLGGATDLSVKLKPAALSEVITVTAESTPVFSSERTGAVTSVTRDTIATLPTLGDRIDSFTKLSPQSSGGLSFGGADNRLNNITIDGSYYNNSFGLGGAPGDRTGVAPISMAAVEEISVNVAPFDVTQGHFVGAAVNSVTRSGTNSYRGSAYWWLRNESMVGKKAGAFAFNPGTFDFHKYGGWASGPVVKNKLFFFLSYEDDALVQPGTTFRANKGGEPVAGNVTRPLASDLDALSAFLKTNFKYDTGPYEGYDSETPSTRYLAKLDYNLNDRNKFTVRFSRLDSFTDVLLSNSASAGFGNRRTPFTTGLNFQNSNYGILENNRSAVAEWNGTFGSSSSNKLILQFHKSDESRKYRGTLFPLVDILEAGSVYTTFGFEPFTPNNELRYKSFAGTDNFTMYRGNHTITVGATAERYESENVFYPASQGVYVYNSLADFYTDARGYLANPSRTTSPVTLRSFQTRYLNIPGLTKPTQPLEVWYGGIYGMDQWQVSKDLKVGFGLRIERTSFGDTGFQNAPADALTFLDENLKPVKYSTKALPAPKLQWNPRFGFNWDVAGDQKTQVRGSSGIMSGPPLYVWISNQIGNTGVLTGFISETNTTTRPFNPDPNAYHPTAVSGQPASTYELALTDPNFKFPQVWRSNLAVDRKLPWNVIATAELLYNRDVNGIYYINANLTAPNSAFVGADNRPRWTTAACSLNAPPSATNCANRVNPNVQNAVVLKNQSVGRSWHSSIALEKRFSRGFLKTAYSYGESKNTVDPGSIASGSWQQNQMSGNPNNPGLSLSQYTPGNRFFVAGSYSREYLKLGKTTVGFFWQATQFSGNYTVSGDLNNDGGGSAQDLIYIQRNPGETTFVNQTVGGVLFTAAQQSAAWEAYIAQDAYLSKHRGEYAGRNAAFSPMIRSMDVSLTQDLFRNIKGKRNGLQFRVDVANFANLLNHNWGIGRRFVNQQPLILASTAQGGPISPSGAPQYVMRVISGALMSKTFEPTAGIGDVYRLQFQLKYNFN